MLEVMVGAMLLLIAMAGLVPFFISGLSQSASVRYKSTANNIAREKMEEIRQLDYRAITGVTFLEDTFGASETVRDVDYTITYEVVESPYGEGTLKEISVEVGWTAPPTVSATKLTTMFHNQYAGPRISRVEVNDPTPGDDDLGTPFGVLKSPTIYNVYCHVAEVDWSLVCKDLTASSPELIDGVYMRLYRVNDVGASKVVADNVVDLRWTKDEGTVTDLYFVCPVDSSSLDDGYWEFRTWIFNQYGEPGNVWRIRLRVENGAPDGPSYLTGEAEEDNESIQLFWGGGDDTDCDYYCIDRRGRSYTGGVGWGLWGDWETVDHYVDADALELPYIDEGDVDSDPPQDPWGTVSDLRQYQYRIWAVDSVGNGDVDYAYYMPEEEWIIIPSDTPLPDDDPYNDPYVTPSIDTYTITILNTVNKVWNFEILDGVDGHQVLLGTIEKSSVSEETIFTGLEGGNYTMNAWTAGKDPVENVSLDLDDDYDPATYALELY